MNLPAANPERWQVPHLKIAERFRLRILPVAFRHGTEKLHLAVLAPHPARMIHVRGERPSRLRAPSSAVMRDHVSKTIALKFHVRTTAELPFDFRPHRVLMKWRRRLVRQRFDDCEHFFLAHLRLTIRGLQPGQRHKLALVQHHRSGPAQEAPPLPGAAGHDEKDEHEKGERDERVDSPD